MAARTRQTKCVHLEHFILVHLTQPLSHTLKHTWAQQRKRRKRRRRERSAGPFSGIQAFEREYSHFMSEVEYLASILNIWECFNNHSAQYHSPRSPEQSPETLLINVNFKKNTFFFHFFNVIFHISWSYSLFSSRQQSHTSSCCRLTFLYVILKTSVVSVFPDIYIFLRLCSGLT